MSKKIASMEELKTRPFFIWGAGRMGKAALHYVMTFEHITPVAVIDSNSQLWGQKIEGVPVLGWEQCAKTIAPDAVILIGITLWQQQIIEEIEMEIRESGCCQNIIRINDLYSLIARPDQTRDYQTAFDQQIEIWTKNIFSEADGWAKVIQPQNVGYQDYSFRRTIREFECDRIPQVTESSVVLDVGCGLYSKFGTQLHGKPLELHAIDPLAAFYNHINQKYDAAFSGSVEPAKKIEFGMFELLSAQFGCDFADYIIIENAMDHCIDPFSALVEALRVLKPGGLLTTRHCINEACHGLYDGLHRWNICPDENNQLLIWNQNNYINASEALREYASIEVIREAGEPRWSPYGSVVANFRKKRQPQESTFQIDNIHRSSRTIQVLLELVAGQHYSDT